MRRLLVGTALALAALGSAPAGPGPEQPSTASQTLRCAACDRSISGQYLEALGKCWHPEHFACTRCRGALAGQPFMDSGGQPYCSRCYAELYNPRCAACGRPITGRYVTALGRSWHPEHFVCAACQRPLEGVSFVPRDGQLYCQGCYSARYSPRCSVCDRPLEGQYLEDYWGDRYCPRHRDELPKCFSCQRLICEPLTGGGVRYADGRHLCHRCRATAIDQVAAGAGTAQRVREALHGMGLDLEGAAIPLRLVGQRELEGAHHHTEPLNGKTRTVVRTQDGRELGRTVEEIMVLYGLPEEHYAAVLAHEYGHAWLFLQRFPPLAPTVEEGLCQALSYLWLSQRGTPEAGFFMQLLRESKDSVYGAGFRQAYAALEGRSFLGLAEYVRQYRGLPAR
jgi:hypothetical protein